VKTTNYFKRAIQRVGRRPHRRPPGRHKVNKSPAIRVFDWGRGGGSEEEVGKEKTTPKLVRTFAFFLN